ncbi:MAG: hypothetical protein HYX21_03890 [Candidatus Yanofskybacteria bacterium]|nr:hypothetical protein [Candidatus Yanofskybacteria bacterium]
MPSLLESFKKKANILSSTLRKGKVYELRQCQKYLKKDACTSDNHDFIGEREADYALEHASGCDNCKAWFKEELCERLREQAEGNSLAEDVLMSHGMMHEILDIDCPTFDDLGNLRN